jgi:hypothetical protein
LDVLDPAAWDDDDTDESHLAGLRRAGLPVVDRHG